MGLVSTVRFSPQETIAALQDPGWSVFFTEGAKDGTKSYRGRSAFQIVN